MSSNFLLWTVMVLFGGGPPLRANISTNPGNMVTLIQADPHHPGTLLAGTAAAQLFRSRDGGISWTALSFPPALRAGLHALVIDHSKPDIYLAALSSELPQYAGVFRSVDAGATWEPLAELKQKQVWALTWWARDGRVLAAGTQEGVFLSADGGDTWKHLSSSASPYPKPVVSIALDPNNRNTIYAGTPHLAWKTTDGGKRWFRMSRGMRDDSDIFAINVDGVRPKRLLAGACSGIYSSIDGGSTWRSLEEAVGGEHRTYLLVRSPHRPNVVFAATSDGLMQSSNGGDTWKLVSPESTRSIAFDPVDSRLVFAATRKGVLRSQDGGLHFALLSTDSGL